MRLRCTRMVNRAWAYNERKLNVSADVVTADAGAGGVSISATLDANLLDLAGTELDLPVQAANTVFAGPAAGAPAAPAFRAPVEADIPDHDILSWHYTVNVDVLDVIGVTEAATLGWLHPLASCNPDAHLLCTDSRGQVGVLGLGIGGAPDAALLGRITFTAGVNTSEVHYHQTDALADAVYTEDFFLCAGIGVGKTAVTAGNVAALGNVSGATLTGTGLTATRVLFVGAGGLLADDADLTFTVATNLLTVGGPIAALGLVSVSIEDAVTSAITEICQLRHNSTGTPAAGFGASLGFYLESSTTESQAAGRLRYYWQTASHATRAAYGVISAYGQTAERDCILFGASVLGGGSMVGFHGIGPIVRPSAYTQTYSTASRTHASPTAASVSVTATQTNPWGYSAKSEADAIVTAINNLIFDVANVKQVLNQVLDDLQAYGLLA